jgi:glycerophosphoryl diester phosphodiesterase
MPDVIAHRGAPEGPPENSLAAFERAISRGAHGIEFDVRLSADGKPFVFHNFELDEMSNATGPLVRLSADEISKVRLTSREDGEHAIPSLEDVLDLAAGERILEIELKALEYEIVDAVVRALRPHRRHWDLMEITSFEPALLNATRSECSIPVDILTPASEHWMTPDYVGYWGVQRARLSGARAVHLQVTQLNPSVIDWIRSNNFDVHVHGVNARDDLASVLGFEIGRFDTDNLDEIQQWLVESHNE